MKSLRVLHPPRNPALWEDPCTLRVSDIEYCSDFVKPDFDFITNIRHFDTRKILENNQHKDNTKNSRSKVVISSSRGSIDIRKC